MSKFCAACGGALTPQSIFCPSCGAAVGGAPGAVSAPTARLAQARRGALGNPLFVAGLVAVAVLAVAGGAVWYAGWFGSGKADGTVDGTVVTDEDDLDDARPEVWFANYKDKFLSDGETRYVTSIARKRDYPTSHGSTVKATLHAGSRLSGRWVEGADPTTKWLKTDDGGYVWEGNLGEQHARVQGQSYIVRDEGCQGEMCGEYRDSGLKAERAVPVFRNIDSGEKIGALKSGARVKVLENRILVRQEGEATVVCDGIEIYPHASGDGEYPAPQHLDPGTKIRTIHYEGEGYVAAYLPGGRSGTTFSFEDQCVRHDKNYVAEDWIRLRLPDGEMGWASVEHLQSLM